MDYIWVNKPLRVYNPLGILPKISGWTAQPKYDGKRVLIACENNKVTLFGRQNQKFKEERPWLAELPFVQPFLLDGELLRNGNIYFWDYAIMGGEAHYRKRYRERWKQIKDLQSVECGGHRFALVDVVVAKDYQKLMEPSMSDFEAIEGCVFKNPDATDMFGIYSTSEVSSMIKYRIK